LLVHPSSHLLIQLLTTYQPEQACSWYPRWPGDYLHEARL